MFSIALYADPCSVGPAALSSLAVGGAVNLHYADPCSGGPAALSSIAVGGTLKVNVAWPVPARSRLRVLGGLKMGFRPGPGLHQSFSLVNYIP